MTDVYTRATDPAKRFASQVLMYGGYVAVLAHPVSGAPLVVPAAAGEATRTATNPATNGTNGSPASSF